MQRDSKILLNYYIVESGIKTQPMHASTHFSSEL